MQPVNLSDFINRDDVWVIERGGGDGFALKATHSFAVLSKLFGQQLERDLASEPLVVRQINLSHPARAEEQEDLIVSKSLPHERDGWICGDHLGRNFQSRRDQKAASLLV